MRPVPRKNSIRHPSDRDVGTCLFDLRNLENPGSQLGWEKIPLSLTDPVPSWKPMLRFFPSAKRSLDSLLNLITDLVADGLPFFRLLFRSRTAPQRGSPVSAPGIHRCRDGDHCKSNDEV